MINENFAWDWNYGDAINKSLMSYGIDQETDEVEVQVVVDIPDTIKIKEGVASTSERTQITRVFPPRLQDYEVVGVDGVRTNGKLVHFASLAGVEPINYSGALKNI